VDAEAWASATKAPVFPGQVNRWILVRGARDDATRAQVLEEVPIVVSKALGYTLIPPLTPGLKIISVELLDGQPKLEQRQGARIEELPEPIAVPSRPGHPAWWVKVEFATSTGTTSTPWPVFVASTLGLRGTIGWDWEPSMEADWLLWAVDKPRKATEDEEPKPVVQRLEEGVATVVKVIGFAVAAAVVVVVVNFARGK
jgi:hypothetical protein